MNKKDNRTKQLAVRRVLWERIKIAAAKKDVPMQELSNFLLFEALKLNLHDKMP